ncbi:MAG: DUF2238 domain-containing protein [Clostridiales bacterium]|nr:DUF2238 domain-containing protein [Clostridiales bacterium]
MNKKILNTSIAFTFIGVINAAVYIVLMVMGVTPFFMTKAFAFLMIALFFLAVWVPVIINRIFKINFSLSLVIAYDVFLIMGVLAGTLWEVYKISLVFDKIVHFASGILIAILAYDLFSAGNKRKLSPVWTFIVVFSITMMIGGLWEIWEFAFDMLFEQNSQSWMGFVGHEVLLDTMLDLICDCAGGILGGLYAAITEWNKVRVKTTKHRQVIDVEDVAVARQQ